MPTASNMPCRRSLPRRHAIFLVLQACLKQFQLLDLMRAEMDEKRQQPAQVMQTLGRHLHFRRKPIIEAGSENLDCRRQSP